MTERVAIIGLGSFGYAVARQLARRGAEVLAIDIKDELVENIKEDVAVSVALDSTDIKALASQGISEMDAVLVGIGENTEALLLTTVHLLDLGVKRIIARANNAQQRMILGKLGIPEIISPEDEIGVIVADALINPSKKATMPLPDNFEIVDLMIPKRLVNKLVGDVGFEKNYQLKLVAIKRRYEEFFKGEKRYVDHLLKFVNEETILQADDELILLGHKNNISKLLDINS